jgi:hypothetical protein
MSNGDVWIIPALSTGTPGTPTRIAYYTLNSVSRDSGLATRAIGTIGDSSRRIHGSTHRQSRN